jgi:hypothetical protein
VVYLLFGSSLDFSNVWAPPHERLGVDLNEIPKSYGTGDSALSHISAFVDFFKEKISFMKMT